MCCPAWIAASSPKWPSLRPVAGQPPAPDYPGFVTRLQSSDRFGWSSLLMKAMQIAVRADAEEHEIGHIAHLGRGRCLHGPIERFNANIHRGVFLGERLGASQIKPVEQARLAA